MGGVDAFDQLASSYRLLRRSKKSWKCMYYDLVEIATINAYILMQEYRKENPDELPRPASYSQSNFRASLVRQLAGLTLDQPSPLPAHGRKRRHSEGDEEADEEDEQHLPTGMSTRGNCKFCYQRDKTEIKTYIACSVCKGPKGKPSYFCVMQNRQCFRDYHQH
eukprot:scpid49279/ scgid34660/ 